MVKRRKTGHVLTSKFDMEGARSKHHRIAPSSPDVANHTGGITRRVRTPTQASPAVDPNTFEMGANPDSGAMSRTLQGPADYPGEEIGA